MEKRLRCQGHVQQKSMTKPLSSDIVQVEVIWEHGKTEKTILRIVR